MKKFLFLALIVLLCACSSTKFDLKPQAVSNPVQGPLVKIVSVDDQRTFQKDPPDPATPSLSDQSSDKSKAIGRWRNGYGMAMGNVFLKDDQSVNEVVRERIANALRQAGYRVVSENDPQASAATPLSVEIQKLWGWMQPGALQLTVNFDAEVVLMGKLAPGIAGHTFRANSQVKSMLLSNSDWREALQSGMQELESAVTQKLRR